MKRKILGILLAFVLVFSLLPAAALASYADTEDHWAETAIDKWSDLGILEGWDGSFKPNDPITRGDFALVVDRIMQYKTSSDTYFGDLDNTYYTEAILHANNAGIMTGDAGLIRPTDDITREEAFKMLAMAFGVMTSDVSAGYDDQADISSWAEGYINALTALGYIEGNDNMCMPQDTITRAEVVTVLDNAISLLCNTAQTYSDMNLSGIVIINTPGVTLDDVVIDGDLIIAEGVGDGEATLNNVTVTGSTIVRGGGENSIYITGTSDISMLIIEKTDDGKIRVVTESGATVDVVYVDDGSDEIILTGTFGSVTIDAGVTVRAVNAAVDMVTINHEDGVFIIDELSSVGTLVANAACTIENNGTIDTYEKNVNDVTFTGNEPGETLYAEGVAGAKDEDPEDPAIVFTTTIDSLTVLDASTITFYSDNGNEIIKWNGQQLSTLTTVGMNTVTVPLMESGVANTVSFSQADHVTYTTDVTWVEPYDTTATLGSWVQDRTDPLVWDITDGWITLTTKEEPSNSWYAWQGRSADTGMGPTTDWIVETQFEITEDMATRDGVRASMWLSTEGFDGFRSSGWGGVIDWTILQYKRDSATDVAGWQWWDSNGTGTWNDITGIPTEAGIYDITMTCSNGLIKQYIDGTLVYQYSVDPGDGLTAPTHIIMQSYSFGESYTIKAAVPEVRYLDMYPADAVYIYDVEDLENALLNQADGQLWLMAEGTYELDARAQITTAITVKGIGDVVIQPSDTFINDGSISGGEKNLIAVQNVADLVVLENLTIQNGLRFGLSAYQSDDVVLVDVTIKGCGFTDGVAGLGVTGSSVEANNLLSLVNNSGVKVDDHGAKDAVFIFSNSTFNDAQYQIYSENGNVTVSTVDAGYQAYQPDPNDPFMFWSNMGNPFDISITKGGVTTQYATIQAAVDAAADGDTIDIAAGTYELTQQLNITTPLTLNGIGSVTVKAVTDTLGGWPTDNSHKHLIKFAAGDASNPITVNNITFDADGESAGINTYDNAYLILNDVTVKNSRNAAMIVNGSTVTATNFNTTGNSWGAVNVDPGSGVATPSVFTLVSGTLSEAGQIWSDGSHVEEAAPTATVTVNAPAGYQAYQPDSSDANTRFWSNMGNPFDISITKGGVTTQYVTIQAAVDAAADGDTINVAAGTYSEAVTVSTAGITLKGAPGAIVDAGNPATNVAFSVLADNVKIDGFTIKNAYAGVYVPNDADGIKVNGNTIVSSSNGVVFSQYSTGGTVTDNVITSPYGYGIVIGYYTSNTGPFATGFTVSNNTVSGAGLSGIYADIYSHGNTYTYNSVSGCSGNGIDLYKSNNDIVQGNTITECTGHGLCLFGSFENVIAENTISDNGGYGVMIRFSWGTGDPSENGGNNFSFNTITNNDTNGTQLYEEQHESDTNFYGRNYSDNDDFGTATTPVVSEFDTDHMILVAVG